MVTCCSGSTGHLMRLRQTGCRTSASAAAQRDKAQRDLRQTRCAAGQPGRDDWRAMTRCGLAVADAGLEAAQADLRQTLNLGYTTVTARSAAQRAWKPCRKAAWSAPIRRQPADPHHSDRSSSPSHSTLTISPKSADCVGPPIEGLRRRSSSTAKRARASLTLPTATLIRRPEPAGGHCSTMETRLVPGKFVQVTLSGLTLHRGTDGPEERRGAGVRGVRYLADHGRARRVDMGLKQNAGNDWVVSGVRSGDLIVTEGLVHVPRAANRVAQQ